MEEVLAHPDRLLYALAFGLGVLWALARVLGVRGAGVFLALAILALAMGLYLGLQ